MDECYLEREMRLGGSPCYQLGAKEQATVVSLPLYQWFGFFCLLKQEVHVSFKWRILSAVA